MRQSFDMIVHIIVRQKSAIINQDILKPIGEMLDFSNLFLE